jgi:putative component of toxin-antitoxin plasmid stabilization module
MNKMTDWFPSHIKPVRKGVYEVRTPNKGNKYCYYDRLGWRLCCGRIDYAEQEKHYTSEFMHSSMVLVGSKWRGFKEKQT